MNATRMTTRVIAAACTATCLSAGGAGLAVAAVPRTITATGTGIVTGTPDELKLSLEASASAASVSLALDQANRAMSAVQDALTADQVAPADRQTSGLSVQPQYNQQNTITGYTVSESLTAELHNLATAGQAITDAIDAGGDAVRVDSVSLDLDDQTAALMARARAEAIADARNKAEQYATAAGIRLGPVLSISENDSSPPLPIAPPSYGISSSTAVPISAGTLRMTASVVATYQIKGLYDTALSALAATVASCGVIWFAWG